MTMFITNVSTVEQAERDQLTATITAAKPGHGFDLSTLSTELLRGVASLVGAGGGSAGPVTNARDPNAGLPLPRYVPRPVKPDTPPAVNHTLAAGANPPGVVANAAPQRGLPLPRFKPRPPGNDN